MTAPARTPCCVPFCRRYTLRPAGEWICAAHWRSIPLRRRKVWTRYRWQTDLAVRDSYRTAPVWIRQGIPRDRPELALDRLWASLKRIAVAKAMCHAA